jgi:diaminopimelate decarboxylase
VLLTRVTELKPPVLVDSELTPFFAGTDTSYNAAVSTVLYGSYHGLYVAERAAAPSTHSYDVVGHLMQAGDVLARGRPLPELREGDLLVMLNCGSYAASRAPQFNERPRPAEVLVQGSQARLVRRAEDVADLLSHQVMQ